MTGNPFTLKSEDKIKEYIAKLRWRYSFTCPICGDSGFWAGKNSTRICKKGKHQISPTNGTSLHRSRIQLTTWFDAIKIIVLEKDKYKKKTRANAWSFFEKNDLGSYSTSYYLFSQIRKALASSRPTSMSGNVEVGYVDPPVIKSTEEKLLIIMSNQERIKVRFGDLGASRLVKSHIRRIRLSYIKPSLFKNELHKISAGSVLDIPKAIVSDLDHKQQGMRLVKSYSNNSISQMTSGCSKIFDHIKFVLSEVYGSNIKEEALDDYLLEIEFRYNNKSLSRKTRFNKVLRSLLTTKSK